MKYKVLICSAIMIASVLDSYSQGVRVHLKNGTSVDYPYAQIDSLVAYGIYNDDPIEVKTNEDVTVNGSMATVSGSIKGVDSDMEVGFIYGMNQKLTEFSKKKVKTMSHDKFSMPIKGLIDDTTYYYRAYAVVDGYYYYGEVNSFKTGEPISYSIDGREFKMIRVDQESGPGFCIMQTELPPNKEMVIAGVTIPELDQNKDAIVMIGEMKNLLGKMRTATGLPFRMPTSEEWTFAAKGGLKSKGYKYSGSDSIDEVAWYKDNSGRKSHDVATKQPNELGIYDMSGNYEEQTNNTDDEYYLDGESYGGSYNDISSDCTPDSYNIGPKGGKVPGTDYYNYKVFVCNNITVRLVYSRVDGDIVYE